MRWMDNNKGDYLSDSTVVEHGQPGWREAKLIHFAHFACAPRKRSDVMREWMEMPKLLELMAKMERENPRLITAPVLELDAQH